MSEYNIIVPDASDLLQMQAMWGEIFGDSPEEIQRFYQHFYRQDYCLVAKAGGQVVSMLHSIEYGACAWGRVLRGAYLYAVATSSPFRGRGLSSVLLREHAESLKKRGVDFAFLIPETESLYSFYARFGFRKALNRRLYVTDNIPAQRCEDMDKVYERYLYHLASRDTYIKLDFRSFALTVGNRQAVLTDNGCVIYTQTDAGIDVRETIGTPPEWLRDTGKKETTGMVLPLSSGFPESCEFELANLLN